MTTKYTDEQIIDYLRTLREGDVLTAVADSDGFYTKGRSYVVHIDDVGDIYVNDNKYFTDYIRLGGNHDCCVAKYIREGVFEIPTASPDSFYVSIRQIAEIGDLKSVTVRVDDAGFAELEALEARSVKSRTLACLYAERDAIQAQIDDLEAV